MSHAHVLFVRLGGAEIISATTTLQSPDVTLPPLPGLDGLAKTPENLPKTTKAYGCGP